MSKKYLLFYQRESTGLDLD